MNRKSCTKRRAWGRGGGRGRGGGALGKPRCERQRRRDRGVKRGARAKKKQKRKKQKGSEAANRPWIGYGSTQSTTHLRHMQLLDPSNAAALRCSCSSALASPNALPPSLPPTPPPPPLPLPSSSQCRRSPLLLRILCFPEAKRTSGGHARPCVNLQRRSKARRLESPPQAPKKEERRLERGWGAHITREEMQTSPDSQKKRRKQANKGKKVPQGAATAVTDTQTSRSTKPSQMWPKCQRRDNAHAATSARYPLAHPNTHTYTEQTVFKRKQMENTERGGRWGQKKENKKAGTVEPGGPTRPFLPLRWRGRRRTNSGSGGREKRNGEWRGGGSKTQQTHKKTKTKRRSGEDGAYPREREAVSIRRPYYTLRVTTTTTAAPS